MRVGRGFVQLAVVDGDAEAQGQRRAIVRLPSTRTSSRRRRRRVSRWAIFGNSFAQSTDEVRPVSLRTGFVRREKPVVLTGALCRSHRRLLVLVRRQNDPDHLSVDDDEKEAGDDVGEHQKENQVSARPDLGRVREAARFEMAVG